MKFESIRGMSGITGSVAAMGLLGAAAGGTIAAIGNSVRVAKGEISAPTAALHVAQEAVGTGLGTAAGVAAIRAIGLGGLGGFIAFFAVAALVKRLWDAAAAPRVSPAKEPAASE